MPYFSRFLFFVSAVVMLVGCAHPTPLSDKTGLPIDGPIAIGDLRKPIAGACGTYTMYWGYCDLIFEDKNGRNVDAFRIRTELDRIAANHTSLSKWVRSVEGDKESELPYDMYLLTISPEIVLVVPREIKRQKNCPSVYQNGCIQSKSFRAHSYWYNTPPNIRSGSFWFSPSQSGMNEINTIDSEAVISFNDTVVKLSPNQGQWRVFREK
jgi:hypothetical protein